MAFNPFNIFRRNQRAIFAVLTVFIMFMFVLSSGIGGGADFFDWFPRWLLTKKNRGDALCTLDGSRVYPRDLEALRRDRVLANKFMAYAAGEAQENMLRYARERLPQLGPEARAAVGAVFQTEQAIQRAALQEYGRNPQVMGFFYQQLQQSVAALRPLLASPTLPPDDKPAVRATLTAYSLNARIGARGGEYFGNVVGNRTSRDAVEFLIWDRKAKDLGIAFAEADVKALVQAEFQGHFTNDVAVREALRRENPLFTTEACWRALATEFRVRTAQAALLGPVSDRADRTLTGLPVFAPAYEVYDYFRDKTSPTTYEVLAVPAANFVARVTAEPTEEEVRKLYDEHKDREPDPGREEPGFRDPRKVKVEWVAATGEEPYYRNLAAEALRLGPAAAALAPPGPGGWSGLAGVPLAVHDPLFEKAYKTAVLDEYPSAVRFKWGTSGGLVYPSDVMDATVVKPAVLAAAAGGLGHPLATAHLTAGAVVAEEQKARVKAGMPFVLAGVPGPGLLPQFAGAEVAYRQAVPGPLPLAAVKPDLLRKLVETKAQGLVQKDLTDLREQVGKLTDGGKKVTPQTREAVAAYVAEFVKVRGLQTGRSADFQSEYTIADDPGLASLKGLADKSAGPTPPGMAPPAFGRGFFYDGMAALGGRPGPALGTYKPEFYPDRPFGSAASAGKAEPTFLSWRTDERAAVGVPRDAARPRVVEAWKRLEARKLAKEAAERIATDLRAFPGTAPDQFLPWLRDRQAELQAKAADPAGKERVKLFRVDKVAPLVVADDPTQVMMGTGGQLRGFEFRESADIPYPTREMGKALLDGRTAPPKTVTVLPDRPKDTFYVAVVGDRREKSADEFRVALMAAGLSRGGMPTLKDSVMNEFVGENTLKAKTAILALMKKEYQYEETDDQKKRLDESKGDE